MSIQKSKITVYLKDEELKKMRYLAEKDDRRLCNLLEYLCKLHIRNYEKENGEIVVESATYYE